MSDPTAADALRILVSDSAARDIVLCESDPLDSIALGELESCVMFRSKNAGSKDVVLSLLAETVDACGTLMPERKGMKSQEPGDDEKREGVILAEGGRRLEGTEDVCDVVDSTDLAESLERERLIFLEPRLDKVAVAGASSVPFRGSGELASRIIASGRLRGSASIFTV